MPQTKEASDTTGATTGGTSAAGSDPVDVMKGNCYPVDKEHMMNRSVRNGWAAHRSSQRKLSHGIHFNDPK